MLKFGKVKKNTLYVCSVLKAVVHRMTATVNPNQIGIGKLGALSPIWWWIMVLDTGMTPIALGSVIISEAGLHHWTGGVAFRKVVNCVSSFWNFYQI